MRKIKSVFILLTVLTGVWLPISICAAGPIENPGEHDKQAIAIAADDVAACADDPAPAMNGTNPGFAGKPVNVMSGAETYTRTDLSIGTFYPITVRRGYNSRTSYDSPIGHGWAINYDRRIYTYPDGSVTLRKNCGWKKKFTLSGGNYITPLGESGLLARNADNSFTFTYKNGDKDLYDAQGRLTGQRDAKGSSLVIYYEFDIRSPLWGLLPSNVNQTAALIVAYDYRLSRIEEQDASGALTNHYVLFHYNNATTPRAGR